MARARPPAANRATTAATDEDPASPSEVLELLNDEYASEIMSRIHDEPKSASEVAEECGISRATAYRRLNRLNDAGLVDVDMAYDPDGYHRKVFRLAVDSVSIMLAEASLEVDITRDARPSATNR